MARTRWKTEVKEPSNVLGRVQSPQSRKEQGKDRERIREKPASNPHTTYIADGVVGHVLKKSDKKYYKDLTKSLYNVYNVFYTH